MQTAFPKALRAVSANVGAHFFICSIRFSFCLTERPAVVKLNSMQRNALKVLIPLDGTGQLLTGASGGLVVFALARFLGV